MEQPSGQSEVGLLAAVPRSLASVKILWVSYLTEPLRLRKFAKVLAEAITESLTIVS